MINQQFAIVAVAGLCVGCSAGMSSDPAQAAQPVVGEADQPRVQERTWEGPTGISVERRVQTGGRVLDRFFEDGSGAAVTREEATARRQAASERRWSRQGAMNDALFGALSRSSSSRLHRVVGFLVLREMPSDRFTRDQVRADSEIEARRRDLRVLLGQDGSQVTAAINPEVHLHLPEAAIRILAWSGLFRSLALEPEEVDTTQGSTVWHSAIATDQANAAGWMGANRRIAVLELRDDRSGAPNDCDPIVFARWGMSPQPGYHACAVMQMIRFPSFAPHGASPASERVFTHRITLRLRLSDQA